MFKNICICKVKIPTIFNWNYLSFCFSGKVQVKSSDIQVGDLIIVEKVCCLSFLISPPSFVVEGISINVLLCDPSHEILSFFQWDIVSVSLSLSVVHFNCLLGKRPCSIIQQNVKIGLLLQGRVTNIIYTHILLQVQHS